MTFMDCAHDPWEDYCPDCQRCIGCNAHGDYCSEAR